MDTFVMIRNRKVHYVEYGVGIPVFCLHGYECDWRMMAIAMEPIFRNRSGYRRIYIDIPGFGLTPGRHLKNVDEWCEVINETIDALIGKEEKFLLVGESYGCYLEMMLLMDRPQQICGTLFIAPALIAKRPPRQLPPKAVVDIDEEFLQSMNDADRAYMLDHFAVINSLTWFRYKVEAEPAYLMQDKEYTYWIEKNGYESVREKDFLTVTHNAPSCWVTGRQDYWVGYKDPLRFLENFPRATFTVLDGAGHNMHVEKIEIFNEVAKDWLYRVEHFRPFIYDENFVPYPDTCSAERPKEL